MSRATFDQLKHPMRWTIRPIPDKKEVDNLAAAIQVDPIIASLLLQRGVHSYEDAKLFFRPDLSQLHDPFLMKDMKKAVHRIEKAMATNENILVYGDYDVDGTSAVALMASYLLSHYPNVATYIPDRYAEGYGVSFKGIDFASDNGISLIIALDCGIKAIDKVHYASQKGIDFIICDHHRPGELRPQAVAILNPKQSDCSYPYKELCGCGVGFKLIQALGQMREEQVESLVSYLDLVAMAIGADIVPITGENRILCSYGMRVINEAPRPGIQAILNESKRRYFNVTDVVFQVAPRINAAGRMKHGSYAVALLMENDLEKAKLMAQEIDVFNTERKDLDRSTTREVLELIKELGEEDRKSTVVFNPEWHKGILGIVASRVMETYYRPTIVFAKSGEKLAASARSVKGFDIYHALTQCEDFIEQFGGHKYAAGLTIDPSNFKAFKERFEQVVADSIDPQMLIPEIRIDSRMAMERISPRFYRILKQFAPFGPGNSAPCFLAEDLHDTGYARGVGEESRHLKLDVYQPGSAPIGAIGFNLGNKLELIRDRQSFCAVFSIEENEWNGKVNLQLKIKDIRN